MSSSGFCLPLGEGGCVCVYMCVHVCVYVCESVCVCVGVGVRAPTSVCVPVSVSLEVYTVQKTKDVRGSQEICQCGVLCIRNIKERNVLLFSISSKLWDPSSGPGW